MQHNNWSTLTDHLVQRVTRCRGSINSYLVHPRRHISFHTVLLIHEFYYSPLINILYTADIVVLSMLLYGSETWPTTMANRKKPDAAHNKWLKRILHISWRDKKQGRVGKDGTGRYGKHHKKTTLDGTRGKDGGRKTGYTGQRGSIEEADRERTGRKLYVKISKAWL